MTDIAKVKSYLLDLQNRVCAFLKSEDQEAIFCEDHWQHTEQGGGITRLFSDGTMWEKAGVNFSHVAGEALPDAATRQRPDLAHSPFEALGISLVVHPRNPYVPTSHANVRFISVKKKSEIHWWFGGGWDLTPYYGFEEDCRHWHTTAKLACEPFGKSIYPKLKKECDNYFFLKHRNEPRGIGGLFFDDWNTDGFEKSFSFMQSIGNHYLLAYSPIVIKRKNSLFGERERDFQCYRRGRYVEFNLLYDRGTLFGLQSGGRTESILMSLPPITTWKYNWKPERGSEEEKLYQLFLTPRDWI